MVLDFCFDETADLRRVKLFNIVNEFTREALAIDAAHRIDSNGVVATVERLVTSTRRTPASAHQQRPQAHRVDAGGLVPHMGHPHRLHRARITLRDTLGGVLQQTPP